MSTGPRAQLEITDTDVTFSKYISTLVHLEMGVVDITDQFFSAFLPQENLWMKDEILLTRRSKESGDITFNWSLSVKHLKAKLTYTFTLLK